MLKINLSVGKILLIATALFFTTGEEISAQEKYSPAKSGLMTRWAKDVSIKNSLAEYPRPQLIRKKWESLNGQWNYTISSLNSSEQVKQNGVILVPFPIESALSGVKSVLKPDELLWYKRTFRHLPTSMTDRVFLNFGAVDYEATVFMNGRELGKHKGGYTAFSFDVTDVIRNGDNELVVKVYDPSDQGSNPHGKQVLNPQGIMYTPSSGIWQTVWLETVPANYIQSLKITPDVDNGEVKVVVLGGSGPLNIQVYEKGKKIATTSLPEGISPQSGERIVTLKVPNAKLWSPDSPFLYDLKVTLGKDEVSSYFGMRKVEIKKDEKGFERIFLNNKYTYNLGTLDQGFWPDGLYTAPTDEALAFDIKASKAMGFNTIRKHIKVEPARWYYHADRLGMLVWQDLVNPGNDSPEGRSEFEKESKEIVEQLHNYPSITTWVLFNEKWGQYDQQRLTNWLKKVDPTRLVNGHSGEMLYVNDQLRSESPNAWIDADMTDVHAYPMPGHLKFQKDKAAVIGEFGGIGVPIENHLWDDLVAGWGYDGVVKPKKLQEQYTQMVDSLKILEKQGLTASIYTQPFDVESEQNGLMTYDREIIKLPVEVIRNIHKKLWPITSNFVEASKSFSANVAEATTPTYEERLADYKSGKRDARFLRNLAIMADEKKDTANANAVANNYIKIMGSIFEEQNLRFIIHFTRKTSDAGFEAIINNLSKIDSIMGKDEAEYRVMKLIEADYITPNLAKRKVDWDSLESTIRTRFGDLGRETVWQVQVLNAANQNDWASFGRVAKKWFETYGNKRKWMNAQMINSFAWAAFENTSSETALLAALSMTSAGIQLENIPNLLDTHANLLFKLGKRDEAIEWSAKAVAAAPDDEEIKNNYEKIKAGVKTWKN